MKWNEEMIAEAQKLYSSGESISKLARRYSCSFTTMRSLLRSWKVLEENKKEPSRIYKVNDNVFNEETTERDYWAGFFHADGHLHQDRKQIQLELKKEDEGHLEKFRDFLGSNNPIYDKPATRTRFAASSLRLTSNPIYNDLQRLGVKSKPVEELLKSPHFWRGVVDGDGHIGQHKTKTQLKTGISTKKYPLVSVCGDHYTMEKYREFVLGVCPKYRGNLQKRDKITYLVVTGKNAIILLDALYKDSTVHLDRKHRMYIDVT